MQFFFLHMLYVVLFLLNMFKINAIVSDKVNYRGTQSLTFAVDERSAKSGDMISGR